MNKVSLMPEVMIFSIRIFFSCRPVISEPPVCFGYDICNPQRLIEEVVKHGPPPLTFAYFTAPAPPPPFSFSDVALRLRCDRKRYIQQSGNVTRRTL